MKIKTSPVAGCSECGAFAWNPKLIDRPCDKKRDGKKCKGRFKRLPVSEEKKECPDCEGTGRQGPDECPACDGLGWIVDIYA